MVLFRSTKESVDYVLKSDRNEDGSTPDGATTFFMRCIPLRLSTRIMEMITTDFAGAMELGLRAGVAGWRDGEGEAAEGKTQKGTHRILGQTVTDPLTESSYQMIPADAAQELFQQVLIVNRLQKEDVGN